MEILIVKVISKASDMSILKIKKEPIYFGKESDIDITMLKS
jgi:hypothetical protein